MTMHLTDLERRHLEAAASGCTEKCISSRRRVSRNATARTLTRARRKLGANSTTQAVAHYERLKASEELAEFVDDVQAIHERSGSLLSRMRAKLPTRRPGVATCGVLLLLAFVPGWIDDASMPIDPPSITIDAEPVAVPAVEAVPEVAPAAYWFSPDKGRVHTATCTYWGRHASTKTDPEAWKERKWFNTRQECDRWLTDRGIEPCSCKLCGG